MSKLGHMRAELERVLEDIRLKRERQQNVHGWNTVHDDEHYAGELARAAIPYIQSAYQEEIGLEDEELEVFNPWAEWQLNLKQPRRELLVNAAALLVAEIERLDRLEMAVFPQQVSVSDPTIPTTRICCACEKETYVRNMICMDFEGPAGFIGWGCVQCDAPSRGAIAMVCDPCLDANRPPKSICAGKYVSEGVLVSLEGFERIPFKHNMALHPQVSGDEL